MINQNLSWGFIWPLYCIFKASQTLFLIRRFYKLNDSVGFLSLHFKCFIRNSLLYCTPLMLSDFKSKPKHFLSNYLDRIINKITSSSINTANKKINKQKKAALRILHDNKLFLHFDLQKMPLG